MYQASQAKTVPGKASTRGAASVFACAAWQRTHCQKRRSSSCHRSLGPRWAQGGLFHLIINGQSAALPPAPSSMLYTDPPGHEPASIMAPACWSPGAAASTPEVSPRAPLSLLLGGSDQQSEGFFCRRRGGAIWTGLFSADPDRLDPAHATEPMCVRGHRRAETP